MTPRSNRCQCRCAAGLKTNFGTPAIRFGSPVLMVPRAVLPAIKDNSRLRRLSF